MSFEGLLQENVLGTFKMIRGFADLRDLAEVSVAMPYQGAKNGQGTGYQRQVDEQHVEDIKWFLTGEKGDILNFLPNPYEAPVVKGRKLHCHLRIKSELLMRAMIRAKHRGCSYGAVA